MIPLVTLTREPLQMLKVHAIGYGAKNTGEMGGGAATAVLAAAGTEILADLRCKLAGSPHRVGDVVVTPSFKMRSTGVQWVLHVISIIKNTPQGAYCPQPERLRDGVASALSTASKLGAHSVAFSALGTGEGRVEPREAARYMLEGARAFRQSETRTGLTVTFSLPSYRDYEAFHSVIQSL